MKTSFLPRLVNGQTGDPALFVDILREKRALLFDCGTIQQLSPSEILRISDLFVSHAHIDHFIGFDHLLRLHLGRGRRVRIYGPSGITDCVGGRLAGYTWNLVRRQRLVFEVHEWNGQEQLVTEFFCRRRFRPSRPGRLEGSGALWEDDHITVHSVMLDHKTTSLAFSVTERDFHNVDPVQLEATGLRPGPWLNELKRWVRQGRGPGGRVDVDGELHDAAELADRLLIVTPGKKIVYVADAQGNQANFQAIQGLARGADLLFCEGAFLHEDADRARETYHLTARQAGEVARACGVKRLVVFHFSPKYEGRFAELEEEARVHFQEEGDH